MIVVNINEIGLAKTSLMGGVWYQLGGQDFRYFLNGLGNICGS